MITFFTTPKPFVGHLKTIQNNSLKNWKSLSQDIEIIVFGELSGDLSVFDEIDIIRIPHIELFDNKLPLVNSMFVKAGEIAKNPVCCYLNADILVNDIFFDTVKQLHLKIKKDYLLVGQRYDFDIYEDLSFESNWEASLRSKYLMELHPPTGSDFFVFPSKQYQLSDIPDLVIGRPYWDLWMIFNGVKQRNLKTINISKKVIVYHQNHSNNYRPVTSPEDETRHNSSFLPADEPFKYTLAECNYKICGRMVFKKNNTAFARKIQSFDSRLRRKLKSLFL